MDQRNSCVVKNTMLPAALTIGAALGILVLSVVPRFVLHESKFFVPGLIPHLIANSFLCVLLFFWLYITGTTIRVALHAALTIVTAFAVLVLSVIPPLLLSNGAVTNSGVISHIMAYGVLCIMACTWLHVAGISRSPVSSSVFLCMLYGCVTECIQIMIPYRTFEFKDILINSSAVLFFSIVSKMIIQCVPFYRYVASLKDRA